MNDLKKIELLAVLRLAGNRVAGLFVNQWSGDSIFEVGTGRISQLFAFDPTVTARCCVPKHTQRRQGEPDRGPKGQGGLIGRIGSRR